MKQNHLIIGLGGTGGKIIRAFKKTLYQEYHNTEPEKVEIQYLYIDSSKEMMGLDDPSWKHLGKNLQLSPSQQLLITGANLKQQLENINNFPGIKPWIGDKEQWQNILGSIVGETLGGQKRRLGRFLFAAKINEFRSQVTHLVNDLKKSGSSSVTFHVCCGLAGGTGSGSIIDTLCHLREMFSDPKQYKIIIYALLPETHPNPNWNTGNYFANGYAALLELNALSINQYKPHDITAKYERLTLNDPFNGCYIFNNENENGLNIDVSKEIPNLVADFLYLKIVGVTDMSWDTLMRMENAENGDGSPETLPGSKTPARSKRFLAFGIKRLIIPEEEITEYLTFNFALQSVNQALYNNWSDTLGFLEDPKNSDFHTYIKEKETMQKWYMTDDHLCLSLPVLKQERNDKRFKPVNDDWNEVINNFKIVAREKNDKVWLDELQKMCDLRFNQQFRGIGVKNFYDSKLLAKKEYAKEIRGIIENEIFDNWTNAQMSIYEANKLLDALLLDIETRIKEIENKLSISREKEESNSQQIISLRSQWSHTGIIGGFLGKKDRLFDEFAIILLEFNIYKTRTFALQFARELIIELNNELMGLKNDLNKTISLLVESTKKFKENISVRCQDGGKEDLRMQVIKFYNPDHVKHFSNTLTRDKGIQSAQTNRIRNLLISTLGDLKTFAYFNSRFSIDSFLDLLENISEKNATEAHNNFIANNKDTARILNVNIIEKLHKEYGGNDENLRKYITDISGMAGKYLQFDFAEMQKSAPGIPQGVQTAVSQFSVIMPDSKESGNFSEKLKEIFRGSKKGGVEIIEGNSRINEIAMVSITNLFPLRFVKHISFLKEKYDLRLNELGINKASHEIHTEGDGTQFLPLFIPTAEDIKKIGLPLVLIAFAMGLIREGVNPQSGREEILYFSKDEFGLDMPPVNLGCNITDTLEKLDLSFIETLKSEVHNLLKTTYQHVDKETELIKSISGTVDKIKALKGGDFNNSVYLQFLASAREAAKLIKLI